MITDLIKAEFNRRKQVNPSYSLRAMAQLLGLQPGRLSEYLTGKRKISLATQARILKHFHLTEMFHPAPLDASPDKSRKSIKSISDDVFNIIADSIHFEILSLMDTKDFSPKLKWMAQRLGKDEMQVRWALEKMIKVGLISKTSDGYNKENFHLKTSSDVEYHALKESHLKTMKQAESALFEIPVDLRDISSLTVAVDMKKLPLAKTLIKNFRRQLCTLLENKEASEVYHLNIQLFPATKIKNSKGVMP